MSIDNFFFKSQLSQKQIRQNWSHHLSLQKFPNLLCLKPRPNDRNIWTHISSISRHCWVQHFACVWPPYCDVLRHVGCCWLKFENGQIFYATFMDVAWCCSCLARFVQQCCAWECAVVRFSTRHMSQHVATRWPKACNVAPNNVAICCLQMLRSFGRNYRWWANNVGICCVEMLPSFDGRGFTIVEGVSQAKNRCRLNERKDKRKRGGLPRRTPILMLQGCSSHHYWSPHVAWVWRPFCDVLQHVAPVHAH